MNDRELLELAAKAAGYSVKWCKARKRMELWHDNGGAGVFLGEWKPLTDDGDALRLAVTLRLFLDITYPDIRVGWIDDYESGLCQSISHQFDGDLSAAVRYSIVRAAAEIGKAKSQG